MDDLNTRIDNNLKRRDWDNARDTQTEIVNRLEGWDWGVEGRDNDDVTVEYAAWCHRRDLEHNDASILAYARDALGQDPSLYDLLK